MESVCARYKKTTDGKNGGFFANAISQAVKLDTLMSFFENTPHNQVRGDSELCAALSLEDPVIITLGGTLSIRRAKMLSIFLDSESEFLT